MGLLGFLPDNYRSGIMHVRINYLNACLHNGIADNSINRSVKLSLLTDLPFVHFLVRNSFKFDGVVSSTWLEFFFFNFHFFTIFVLRFEIYFFYQQLTLGHALSRSYLFTKAGFEPTAVLVIVHWLNAKVVCIRVV